MLCEMCGNENETSLRVSIERSVLSVCPNCAKFGQVLASPTTVSAAGASTSGNRGMQQRLGSHQRRMEERDLYTELPDLELEPDWSARIRVAREKLGWTQEQFGAKLNEKASVVHKLESHAMVPPDALVRKVERTLKIRLTVKAAAAPAP